MNGDLAEWITDGTEEDLDTRARRLAITTVYSYEQARDNIIAFTAVMASIATAATETCITLRSIIWEIESGRVRAGYRAKTRRRNRRIA